MTHLTSKIQYANFEIGEFTQAKERSLEETFELIEHFPWEAQREGITIGLTNPSVTIDGKNDDYLKFALFFHGKFVLHYFNKDQTLYTKSFSKITGSYEYITNYFVSSSFDTKDFKKENTLFQNNLEHFLTQTFQYGVTGKDAVRYLFSTTGINLALTIVLGSLFLTSQSVSINILSLSIAFLFVLLLGGGLNLVLFFRYYLYAKNKILIMSKGNDVFYFGNKENPTKYNKVDIMHFTTLQVKNTKHTINTFALVTIEFNDGSLIEIPNIIIDQSALEYKLSGINKIEKNTLPSLKA
jgi:hypothetical protein